MFLCVIVGGDKVGKTQLIRDFEFVLQPHTIEFEDNWSLDQALDLTTAYLAQYKSKMLVWLVNERKWSDDFQSYISALRDSNIFERVYLLKLVTPPPSLGRLHGM